MTPLANIALVSLLSREPLRIAEGTVRFRSVTTGGSETPLPVGMRPTALTDAPTVAHTVVQADPGNLVREANRYARALAVIAVDPALDAEVDALVQSRVQGTRVKRPLLRKQ